MRMLPYVAFASLQVLVGCGPEDDVFVDPTDEATTISTNGVSFNGVSFNGVSFNGVSFNGVSFNGVSFNGVSFNGVSFNDVALNGVSFNGETLVGTEFVGRGRDRFVGILSNGAEIQLRIDDRQRLDGDNRDVIAYAVSFQ